MLKKFVVFILIMFGLFNFSACGKNTYKKVDINVATLKGPTGLGMLKIIDDSEKCEVNNYNISVFNDPNNVASRLISGEVDIATIPTNMASMIYNKTNGDIKIAAINTLGVLYILSSNDNIKSIEDLKGKTIFASGKGSAPEYALKYVLTQNNLEISKDVTVEYKLDHEELASLAIAGKIDIVLLPEPFVTQVVRKNPSFKVKIDLTDEWNKITLTDNSLPMGCIAVRRQFIKENSLQFDKFLSEYENSINFLNENREIAAELSNKYNIMPKDVAFNAIPKCKVVFISGEEMVEKVNEFLSILFEFEPKSVGGKVPNEELYYKK